MHLLSTTHRFGLELAPPRGFKELFEPCTDSRQQLEVYASTFVSLDMCVCVLSELLAYALAPTQERDLEAKHGRIGARQAKALGARALPTSVGASIRMRYWRPLLRMVV